MPSSQLFQPLQVGDITLEHRIVLAPLTRFRADTTHTHQDIATEYYKQRSQVPGTLLITEATFIAAETGGYANVPGIWSDDQIAAWKKLWAIGRAADPEVIHAEGYPYVSASATQLEGKPETPQELSKNDIKRYVGLYAQAAKNAVHGAGFDGVEIHSANGYLIDQFLQDNCNQRTDEYGGSIENRARFLFEVTDAVVAAVGVKKTGIRFSPWSRFLGMRMKDPVPTFSYVVKELVKRHSELAYIHFTEPLVAGDSDSDPAHGNARESNDFARDIWAPRPFISAGGFTLNSATKLVSERENEAVAFGRLFISNPDLPERLLSGAALTKYNRATFYTPGPVGYTDYPRAQKVEA
ncbi:hypothetical protein FRC09_014450 [Ceratobasidium sp. 395]|nr:hypothetical protein FRC09_014450 [Ceratobasidium sp. 395]